MSLLARATARPIKGLDQQTTAQMPQGGIYIPIESRSTFSESWNTAQDAAMMIATFYACVRVLAESIGSLPLFLYRREEGGGKRRATDHEWYQTFHDAPNPAMTSFSWRELLVSHMATWGDGYNEIAFDPLGRLQLWPIRPDRIEPRWDSTGTQKLYDYLSPTGGRRTMRPGSVFHVPALSPTGLKGYSPVALHRKTLEVHNAARDFGKNFFRNNARPAIVLSHPKTLSDGAITRLAGQMEELKGSGNAGKTVVMEEGLDIHEIGIPPDDAQYIQTRVHEDREIQKIFRMPPHMVGDLERATFSNIEHQGIEFVVYTLRPWLVRIEQEIKHQLLFDQPDIFAEFLVDGLLRGDAKGRATALQIQRQNGVINGDEWREIENLNPSEDGSGKEYWRPANMIPIGAEGEEEEGAAEGETEQPILRAVRSAAVEMRCPACNKLLLKGAMPGSFGECARCKTEVAV